MSLPLTRTEHLEISADQVKHALSPDGWSSFDFGIDRIQIPITDLTRVTEACEIAEAIAAQAGFWARDLREIRDRLATEEEAHLNASAPDTNPTPAPAPEPPADDEPFGGDDPKLDAAVARVTDMPETRRKPKAATPEDKS